MDNLANVIIAMILGTLYFVWWWSIAKEASYRKYLLLIGLCLLITGAAVLIGVSMDLPFLGVIAAVAFVLAIYFFIKAALSAHREKKKMSDEQ